MQGRAAVFLDRDGVIIEDPGYLANPANVRFIPGSVDAVARLNRTGVAVVIVTNQSGVGRGFYSWQDFEDVQAVIESELAAAGAWIDGVWACAYHGEGVDAYRVSNHPFRKPNPGMLEDAAQAMGLSLSSSWMVGDRIGDIQAGLGAGVRQVMHVLTGVGERDRHEVAGMIGDRIRQEADLAASVEVVLRTLDESGNSLVRPCWPAVSSRPATVPAEPKSANAAQRECSGQEGQNS